jgi:hypothetical protein
VYHHNHHLVTRKHKEENVSKHKLESTCCDNHVAVVRAAQPQWKFFFFEEATMEVKP